MVIDVSSPTTMKDGGEPSMYVYVYIYMPPHKAVETRSLSRSKYSHTWKPRTLCSNAQSLHDHFVWQLPQHLPAEVKKAKEAAWQMHMHDTYCRPVSAR